MSNFLRYSILFLFITNVHFVMLGNEINYGFNNLENGITKNSNVLADSITGTIEVNNNSACLNAQKPLITLTGKNGTSPYTFIINLNNIKDTTITTANGSNKATFNVPTSAPGTFTYTLNKVTDSTNAFQDLTEKVNVVVNSPPISDFDFTNNNTCSGTPIEFTPKANGNLKYKWDFGDGTPLLEEKNPTHYFAAFGTGTKVFNIKLTVIDNSTLCQSSFSKTISVKEGPDASFNLVESNGATYYDAQKKMFINCGATITSPQFNFVAVNASKTNSTNTGYSIDWGDGTVSENLPALFVKAEHLYNNLGFFDIKVTAKNDKAECKSTTTNYKFFNGNSPAGNLGSIGNTTDCSPYTLKWPVENYKNNPPGTTYTFSVNDGSSTQNYDQSNLPDSISHTFTSSSCNIAEKKFTVIFVAKNPCDSSRTTLQVKATEKPTANFDVSPNLCLNSTVRFTNVSTGSYDDCKTNFNATWSISPATGWTGNLTNQNSGDIIFNTAGNYSVKLKIKKPNSSDSRCTSDSITKIITINPLPTATLSGGATVCLNSAKPEITFTGSNGKSPYTFTYKINGGGNQTISSNAGNNSVKLPASTDNAGTFTYTLVSVQEDSGCSQNQTGTAIIIVNPAPLASIAGTQNACLNGTEPLVTFTGSSGTAPYTFTYNINEGANKTVTTTSGNSVTVAAPINVLGVFKYNLTGVSDASANACSQPISGSATITINQPPASMILDNYEFCNGVATPEIVFTNTVPGTTYNWTNSNTSIGLGASGTGNIPAFTAKNTTASPIVATITVTPKANSCSGTSQIFTITVNPSATVIFTPSNQTICSGENTSEVVLTSATAGAELSWTAVQPAGITGVETSGTNLIPVQTLSNSTSAPIDVIYKAKATTSGSTSCAGAEFNYIITVNPRPVIIESFKENICSNSLFNVAPTNGGGNEIPVGTKYSWSTPIINPAGALTGANEQNVPQSTISQTLINTTLSTATATYTVTPSFNDCIGNPFEIVVSVSPEPIVNPVGDITLCNSEQSPEIVFSGNPTGTIFKWSSDNTGIGMATSGDDNIPAFTAINTGTSPMKAIVTVTPTYETGGLPCEGKSIQFSITVNPTGQVNNPGSQNVCEGQSAVVNFSTKNTVGTTTYSWTNDNVNIGLGASGDGNILFTPINNGNSAITATIIVTPTFTNNGISCQGTSEQFTITVNPTASVNQPDNQEICNGVETNEVIFTGDSPDAIYNWTNDEISIGLPASGQGNIPSFFAKNNSAIPLVATITVTPVINGCNGPAKNFTITVNPAGIVTKQPVSSTVCLGEIPTQLSVAYTNGSGTPSYQWYSNTTNNINGGVPILNADKDVYNPPFTIANTTYYYCIISFPSGSCNTLISDIAQVTINPYPDISTINVEISTGETFTVIPNSFNGDIVPTGTTYIWSEPIISPVGSVTGTSAQSSPQTSISQTLTNNTTSVATVTYTVTPTAGSCKGAAFQVIVKVSPPLDTNAKVTPISCFGVYNGNIEINIQGGVPISPGNTYITQWTGPNGYTSSSANIYNLEPGDYNLEVTDAIGTKYYFSYTIIEPDDISVVTDTEKDITCFGAANGEIELTTSGGTGAYKYTWTKDNAFFADTEDITNLSPGLYEVTVTDFNSCGPKILSYNITEPAALAINLISQTDVKCFGDSTGAITVDVQGGTKIEVSTGVFDYKYAWTGPGGFSSTERDLNNIPAGNYNLMVTDSSGCSQAFPVLINQTEEIIVLAKQKTISCYGQNDASIEVTISGGIAPYETRWDNFASGTFQDNLSPGDYAITVTDALGCKKTIVETVLEADIFTISPEVKHVTCAGASNGSIQLNFEGGLDPISFAWEDNPMVGSTRNNLGPGTYKVDIAEGGGCIISKTFVIIEPMPLVLTASISSVFDCTIENGGAIDLSVIGGIPPYKYSWSNGSNTEDLSEIPAGNYLVTVTDSLGCSQTEQYTINRPPSISIDVIPKIEYCNTDSLKVICTALVSGGVPPFQLDWSMGKVSGTNNEIMETDQSGTVVLKVIDSAGCSASKTFQTKIPKLGINNSIINCNQRNYQFNALVANENLEVYSYIWDFGDGTSSTSRNPEHTFPSDGIFKVLLTVTNVTNPCVSNYEQIIDVEPRPNVKIEGLQQFCEGESITIKANGADTYTWTNGSDADTLLIEQEGIYGVTGYSDAGCYNTDNYSVSFFEPLNYRINSDKNEVSLDDKIVSFSTEYTQNSYYTWDFGDKSIKPEGVDLSNPNPHTFAINGDGYFDVKLVVTNPNGCIEKDSIKIGINLLSIPNTFTPNGDGKNDYYMEGWNKKIFNRNGVLMFEGTEGWDGNYKGTPVANDTYFVIIYDSSEAAGSVSRNSYVTVLR